MQFQVMNWLSYMRLFLIYNYNLLHILKETDSDRETFQTSYKQKKFNNRMKLKDNSIPVELNQRPIFDVVENWWNLSTIISKSMARSSYLYDKWIINYPISFLRGDLWNSTYQWAPNGISNEDEADSCNQSLDFSQIPAGKEFVPKPYVITNSLKYKSDDYNSVKGTSNVGGCPVLSNLFTEALEFVPEANSSPVEEKIPDTTTNNKTIKIGRDTGNTISYKIKIHNRRKDFKNHPTYGNYELLKQAIRNIIPQPGYQPDGTIGPNMIRFTWHCCGHYDRVTGTGGSSGGTMRFAQEFNDIGNTGLNTAKSYLDQVHEDFPWISYADLYTFAGCVAIEYMGGPIVPWRPGRTDCTDASRVPPNTRLPLATKNADHIKEVFYDRLGFNSQETVALIGGGHGIGGCHARFSGFNGIWTKTPFTWDNSFFTVLLEDEWETGIVPQTGVEQYYNHDKSLMMLNTDMEMLRCPDFRKWVEIFARDENFFNQVFAEAFAKLLELGVIRDPDGIQRVKL